jgi:hypothetical protein
MFHDMYGMFRGMFVSRTRQSVRDSYSRKKKGFAPDMFHAPKIHRRIRPASLSLRTVSFSQGNADDERVVEVGQPPLPASTGGTLCFTNSTNKALLIKDKPEPKTTKPKKPETRR